MTQVSCCILLTGPESFANMGLFYPEPGGNICQMRFLPLSYDGLLSAAFRPIIEYEALCEYFNLVQLNQIYSDVLRAGLSGWQCSDNGEEVVREAYLQWL